MIGKLYVTEDHQPVLEIINPGTEKEKNALIDSACATLSQNFKGELKYPVDIQILEEFSNNPWLSYYILFYLREPDQIIVYPAAAKPKNWTWKQLVDIIQNGKMVPTDGHTGYVKIIEVE